MIIVRIMMNVFLIRYATWRGVFAQKKLFLKKANVVNFFNF